MKKKYFTTKRIAYLAIFIAISVGLNLFSFNFALLTNKVSFINTINALAGIFLGPISGFLVGALGDVLGFLIKPDGPWLPLITLSSGLSGFIPGLLFKPKKIHPMIKITISLILVYIICTVTLNSLAIYLVFIRGKKAFSVFLIGRLPVQSLIFIINAVLIGFLYNALKKFFVFENDSEQIIKTIETTTSEIET